jgi:ribokinase
MLSKAKGSMPQLVVLGSLNMDLVVRTERMPRPGETVAGGEFRTIPGGKGANQAAAAARLGTAVEMVGRVGADGFGAELLANMRAQGVGVAAVLRDQEAATGTATIIVDGHGENAIVLAPGANGRVSLADLDRARPLLADAQFLVMQFEVPRDVVRAAIALAASLGVKVVLNPAPASRVDAAFLQGVHCLVVNETEAETLSGQAVSDLDSARSAGGLLRQFGVPVVIVTLGPQGALLLWAEDTLHVPTQPVQVVDTTAAGDAFVGGLVTARLQGLAWPEAVRYANCAGSLATTVLGAQTSLPSAEAVQRFYREGHP